MTQPTQPLALILYERLLPGSQLVNRLQDLNYRVHTLSEASRLVATAEEIKPILVLADLQSSRNDVCPALARLKQNAATRHLPVIGFGGDNSADLQAESQRAGVTLLVSDAAILNHLPECLQQVLEIE